jgi:hypothetical protein
LVSLVHALKVPSFWQVAAILRRFSVSIAGSQEALKIAAEFFG